MIRPGIPSTVDRDALRSYLQDHLSGASVGRARARKMSQWYADLDIGPELARIAAQISREHAQVENLIDELGLRPGMPMRLAARAVEMVGRLKPNGHGVKSSPVTPLLEVELLRAAVNGKQGLWQVLAQYADDLGLDRTEYERLTGVADDQGRTLEALHAHLRPTALRPATPTS